MRYIFTLLCFVIAGTCFAQLNSVELKSGAGASLGFYNSITAAYAAIPASITQPYLVELTGTYTASNEVYPITMVDKPGASDVNTITIRPAAGVSLRSIVATAAGQPLFRLNNADYIIFDGRAGGVGNTRGLTIQNNGTTSSSCQIDMINGASNNVVRYINSVGVISGTNTTRGILIGSITTGSTSGNSFNLVEYCSLAGSRTLFNLSSSSTAVFHNERNVIRGCEMINPRFAGIWVQFGNDNVTVDSCTFICTTDAGATSTVSACVLVDGLGGDNIFTRNVFTLKNGTNITKVVGIHLRSTSLPASAFIANNFFSFTENNSTSAFVAGIEFGNVALDDPFSAKVFHNTFRIGGTHSNGSSGEVMSSAIHFSETFANNDYQVRNNIFINERSGTVPGVVHTGIYIPVTGLNGAKIFDHNTFNISSGICGVINGTTYGSFAAYQAAAPGGETGSNTAAVQVLSNADLHLAGPSIGNTALAGVFIPEVPMDIENNPRVSVPYRGADEIVSSPLPVSILSFNAKKEDRDVLISWSVTDELNMLGYTVERSFDGRSFSPIGFVSANGQGSSTKNYELKDKYVLADNPGKILYYRLKTAELNGVGKYSKIVILRPGGAGDVKVNVFPNPFLTSLNVNITNAAAADVIIAVMDARGTVVCNKKQQLPAGASVIDLELRNLASGVYYLHVQSEGITSITRLVKL